MDSYLESLIRKGNPVEKKEEQPEMTENEAILAALDDELEEVIEAEAEQEEAIVESVEPVTEEAQSEPVEEAAEPLVEEPEPAAESNAEPIEEPEPEPEPVPEVKQEPPTKTNDYKPEELISVSSIRIFNRPDENDVYNVFQGNVIFKSRINNFALIEYMKPCFGLVKGYTPDI